MIDENDKRTFVCKRLQRLGFAPRLRVKLYGEEFDLIAEPVFDGSGYGIDGISSKSGSLRHLGIPLSVVRTLEREISLIEQLELAA
ncbi:MAG: hypothetical protein WB421_12815 [Terriglobales bacterium]|jgi:hypothetical protein